MAREAAYSAVQGAAMKVWRGEGTFVELLQADPAVRPHLTDADLEEAMDPTDSFKQVDFIFGRVFGEAAMRDTAAPA